MRPRNTVTLVVLILIGSAAAYFLIPAYIRDRHSRTDLEEIRTALREQEQKVRRLRAELQALRTDYRAIERVAREKFRLCRPDEEIYQFEQTPERSVPRE